MNKIAFAKRLSELKAANLPRLSYRDVLTVPDGKESPSEADSVTLDAYFAQFVQPSTDDKGRALCVCCGKRFLDGLMALLGGDGEETTSLEWGLAHGEAHCRSCGWPSRVYHYDIGGKGDEALIKRLNVSLQVHPDGIVLREPQMAEAVP